MLAHCLPAHSCVLSTRCLLSPPCISLLMYLSSPVSSCFPWLVAFHDCLYDEGAMYIVLEYMDGGSLADLLLAARLTGKLRIDRIDVN